jgi:predicted ribosomally synthesized peptide with nif11-like leader
MATEQAHCFMEYARRTPEIQSRIEKLKGASAVRDLVDIAAEAGFAFTEAEYRTAVVEASNGELSDESLDELVRQMGMQS